jgi:hypothetical protein
LICIWSGRNKLFLTYASRGIASKLSCWFHVWLIFLPWWWRRYIPPKRWDASKLH